MKNIVLIFCLAGFSSVSMAQKGYNEWHANWVFGVPVGNSFVTSFSALGFDMGYSKFIKDDFSVGIEFGWSNYYQYAPRKTYEFSNGAATTDLYKYIYTLPITLYGAHYFKAGDLFTPFIRLGLGAQYGEQNLYYNVYETKNENWGFVAIPEIGTIIHFTKGNPWGLHTSVRYRYSTNNTKSLGVNSIQTVDFTLGIAYVMR